MEPKLPGTGRRPGALSKERIVAAAISILDDEGEGALTFRTLASVLATGSGAIYWYVSDKEDLLAAAVDDVVARAMADLLDGMGPRDAIRAIALGMFDAIYSHPWLGAHLARAPWGPAMLRILEGIGGRLWALGVPERARFDVWSALVNYILGVAVQNVAHARLQSSGTDRRTFLATVAASWARLDAIQHPFLRQVATHLHDQDDREQFLAGIDLILAGIGTL